MSRLISRILIALAGCGTRCTACALVLPATVTLVLATLPLLAGVALAAPGLLAAVTLALTVLRLLAAIALAAVALTSLCLLTAITLAALRLLTSVALAAIALAALRLSRLPRASGLRPPVLCRTAAPRISLGLSALRSSMLKLGIYPTVSSAACRLTSCGLFLCLVFFWLPGFCPRRVLLFQILIEFFTHDPLPLFSSILKNLFSYLILHALFYRSIVLNL